MMTLEWFDSSDEYPGWQQQLVYIPVLNLPFHVLIEASSIAALFHDQNYKHADFDQSLIDSREILFILYDDRNKTAQEMVFTGVSDTFSWFSPENILYSFLWDLNSLSGASKFSFSSAGFEITTKNDVTCEEEGFLQLGCDVMTKCDQVKWWLRDEKLQHQSCFAGMGYVFCVKSLLKKFRRRFQFLCTNPSFI